MIKTDYPNPNGYSTTSGTGRPLRRALKKLENISKALTFRSPNVRKRHDSQQSTKFGRVLSHKTNYEDQKNLDGRPKAASQRTSISHT